MGNHYFSHGCILPVVVGLLLGLVSCTPGPSGAPYVPSERTEKASSLRKGFVQAFLEGRWCEADHMYQESQRSYLIQDDFCAAARNSAAAWKLLAYIGREEPALLRETATLAGAGQDCPSIRSFLADPLSGMTGPQERYGVLLRENRFSQLHSSLAQEKDRLLASVTARKAAKKALQTGDQDWARRMVQQARKIDAEHGWLMFIIKDWELERKLSRDPDQREQIRSRISRLASLVRTCGPPFPVQDLPEE